VRAALIRIDDDAMDRRQFAIPLALLLIAIAGGLTLTTQSNRPRGSPQVDTGNSLQNGRGTVDAFGNHATAEEAFVTARLLNCRTSAPLGAPPLVLARGQSLRVLAMEPGWASVADGVDSAGWRRDISRVSARCDAVQSTSVPFSYVLVPI
jgi:hypothetical protein